MKIFAISDLHLSLEVEKPMDVFGGAWENYTEKIRENWQNVVSDEDIVLVAGDISWAMKLEETKKDFEFLGSLKGTKIIIKGNHEYWWNSISAVRNVLPENTYALQNDAVRIGNCVFAGTRGWVVPESTNDVNFTEHDQKMYEREKIRLKLTLDDMKRKRQEGDLTVCMIHYPPFNSKRENSYFTELFEQYQVDVVVYGHLHKSAGRFENITAKNGVKYYLTSADLIDMKPVEII